MENMDKMWNQIYVHVTSQHNQFWYTVIFNTFFTLISLKVNKILIMGIDHSNPYIHSITVLCDSLPEHTPTSVSG